MAQIILPQTGNVQDDIVDKSNANFTELYGTVPTTSQLGLSGSNTGTQNKDALRTAVLTFNEIIVDGIYDMDGDEISLTNDLKLTGVKNKDCGFVQLSSISLFKGNKNAGTFIADDIQFKYPGFQSSPTNIFRMSANEYYETVRVENCYFEGTLRVVFCPTGEYDPDVNTYGIGNLIIKGNEAFEVYSTMFSCENMYSKQELVEGNNIRNLSGCFYSSGLDNGTANRYKINDVRTNIIVRNNVVVNDNDFLVQLPTNYIYVCLALTESLNVNYSGNHVEGLRTDEDFAVYDAYLSSDHVIYDGNRWINNVKFHPTATDNNTLLKSKGAQSEVYTDSLRQYTNNTFIIEDSWLDKIGKTVSDCWVTLYELGAGSDIIIKNNVIDVKGVTALSFFEYNSFDISENKFTFDYNKSSSSGYFYFGSNGSNIGFHSYFERNTITIKNNPLSASQPLIASQLTSDWDNISINGNNVFCDNDSVSSIIKSFSVDQLNISNNVINAQHTQVFEQVEITRLQGSNNVFNTTNPSNYWIAKDGAFVLEEASFESSSFNNGEINIPVNKDIVDESWFTVYLTYADGYGIEEISFKYRLYDLAGVKRINFIKEDDSLFDEVINGQLNATIKLNTSGYDNGISILYTGHTLTPQFQKSTEPTTTFLKTIRIEAIKGNGNL